MGVQHLEKSPLSALATGRGVKPLKYGISVSQGSYITILLGKSLKLRLSDYSLGVGSAISLIT